MSGQHGDAPKPTTLLRYVFTETCIAMTINLALAGVVTSIVTHPAALAHPTYWQALRQLVIPTLGPASAMVPGITGITRNRVAKGRAPAIRVAALSWLPRGLFVRTAIIGIAAVALLGSSFALLLWFLLSAAQPTLTRIVVFMMIYGAAFGLVVVPVVVIAALGDPSPAIAAIPRLTTGRKPISF